MELGGDIEKTSLHGASASPIPSQGLALSLWGACYSEGHREGSSTVQLRKLKPKEGRGLALELLWKDLLVPLATLGRDTSRTNTE